MSDRLEEILRVADSLAPSPPDRAGLAGRVRERLGRQRRRRRVGGVACLMFAGLAGMWVANRPETQRSGNVIALQGTNTQDAGVELAELRRESAARDVMVRELEAAERRVESRKLELAMLRRPSAVDLIQRQQDMAAVVVLHDARQMEDRPNRRQDALERYERVLELFPSSPAAAEARDRLEQLKG